MTRRDWAKAALFGACLPSFAHVATVTLPALFAAELPACIQLPKDLVNQARETGATIIEKRVYSSPVEFGTDRMVPLFSDGTAYLFAFASLESRQKAWDGWNALGTASGLSAISIHRLS